MIVQKEGLMSKKTGQTRWKFNHFFYLTQNSRRLVAFMLGVPDAVHISEPTTAVLTGGCSELK